MEWGDILVHSSSFVEFMDVVVISLLILHARNAQLCAKHTKSYKDFCKNEFSSYLGPRRFAYKFSAKSQFFTFLLRNFRNSEST